MQNLSQTQAYRENVSRVPVQAPIRKPTPVSSGHSSASRPLTHSVNNLAFKFEDIPERSEESFVVAPKIGSKYKG